MLRVLLAVLALTVTARAQDKDTTDPLAMDKTLLASADDSEQDGPGREQPEITGAEILQGLEDGKRSEQLAHESDRLYKEALAAPFFTISNFLDILRVCFLGGQTAMQREQTRVLLKTHEYRKRMEIALATFQFVSAVHDVERGVSFSCPPDHTMEEMYDIVRVWLQENPGEQHLPAETCVVNALKAKWPKKANDPGAKKH